MDEKEKVSLKMKKKKKNHKNNIYLSYAKKRIYYLIIIALVILIIYISTKCIFFKDNSINENKFFSKNKNNTLNITLNKNESFSEDKKETTNDSNIEKDFFLKYKEEIELKNEEFENSPFITVTTVKNILNKIDSKNLNTIEDTNISQENKNSILQKTDKNIISDYIKKILKEPFNINNLKKYNIRINPKISVIVPAYNAEKYLQNFHRSIQDQSFEDIEIIYVDDFSTDKTAEIIKSFQEIDNRIVYLKNKGNKSPFYSRNKGALFARGEYIQFIDADDMLVNNILEKTYSIAKNKLVDIVQYAVIRGNSIFSVINEKYNNKEIITQPELSDQMFYGRGELKQANYYLINKLIKREKFYKALIYMGDDTLKENLYMQEDAMTLFCLLRVAKSLIILEDIGYAYLLGLNNNSLVGKDIDANFVNQILHDNFVELKLLFNKTENNEHDKGVCIEFFQIICNLHSKIAPFVTKGYELFDEVFNLLLKSPFYKEEQKNKFKELRESIMTNRNFNKTGNLI